MQRVQAEMEMRTFINQVHTLGLRFSISAWTMSIGCGSRKNIKSNTWKIHSIL